MAFQWEYLELVGDASSRGLLAWVCSLPLRASAALRLR